MEDRQINRNIVEDVEVKTLLWENAVQKIKDEDLILKELDEEQEELYHLAMDYFTNGNIEKLDEINDKMEKSYEKTRSRLKELGIDENKVPGVCPDCNNTGIKREIKPDKEGNMTVYLKGTCSCFNKPMFDNLARIANLKPTNDFNLLYFDPEQIKYFTYFIKEIKAEEKKFKPFLMLNGGVGTGKTYLAYYLGNEALKAKNDVLFIKSSIMLDKIVSRKMKDMEEAEEFINGFKEIDLLIIDDLGIENISESKMQELTEIIDYRYENKKSLIITTNLSFEEIKARYSERLTSRIKAGGVRMKLQPEDLRNKK